ncbi:hypothetical protein [Hymenobacter volaticus]|uniref:DUF3300 domain-containing protein n=1 Tax=Hymenobacter volaticus TaxID=2932254 RepID=A0ABY4G543_9BACT|nr:hypothetical protein [Hymenobacter volaticus]UOQ66014.1 hypothetical protein MUN86_21280 [Hymenobacter volaticus]
MKLLIKSSLLLLLGLLLQSGAAQAQVRVSVNVGPPAWGPAVGSGVEYYYIPEIDGYYDLYTQQYVYLDPYGYWVSTPYLPSYYASYDPRFFHPVVINYVGRQPWGYIRDHRAYCNQRGWQLGRYYGNNGYYGNGRRGSYAPAPSYRQAPGRYDSSPYNNRGYARSNDFEPSNRGNYSHDDRHDRDNYRRDERSNWDNRNNAGRNNRGFEGSRDERSVPISRGRGR